MIIDPETIGKSSWINHSNDFELALQRPDIEENQFTIIRRDVRSLIDIPNPTPAVQIEAMTSYPGLIYLIKRPTKEAQAISFSDDPNNIIDVRYPNKKLIEQYFDHPDLTFPTAQHIYFLTNQKHIKAYILLFWGVDDKTMHTYGTVNMDF